MFTRLNAADTAPFKPTEQSSRCGYLCRRNKQTGIIFEQTLFILHNDRVIRMGDEEKILVLSFLHVGNKLRDGCDRFEQLMALLIFI